MENKIWFKIRFPSLIKEFENEIWRSFYVLQKSLWNNWPFDKFKIYANFVFQAVFQNWKTEINVFIFVFLEVGKWMDLWYTH
jgi:hypothetical protein